MVAMKEVGGWWCEGGISNPWEESRSGGGELMRMVVVEMGGGEGEVDWGALWEWAGQVLGGLFGGEGFGVEVGVGLITFKSGTLPPNMGHPPFPPSGMLEMNCVRLLEAVLGSCSYPSDPDRRGVAGGVSVDRGIIN